MSQITRGSISLAIGCAFLAVLAVGCSKQNSVAFDPDAGHPADFYTTHPSFYLSSGGTCAECHGEDLSGGISTVSCSSASRDGRGCHAGGPGGGHPSGWLAQHSATNPAQAATCAACHQSKPGTPGCFNNTLCHGAKSPHSAGWRTAHQSTTPAAATGCAGCHPDKGKPSCFTNSACHGGSGHPGGWSAGSQHGAAAKKAPGSSSGFLYCESCHGSGLNGGSVAKQSCRVSSCHGWTAPHGSSWNGGGSNHRSTNGGNAPVCAQCHGSNPGTPGCFNNTLCHGAD